ncbi:hypothetical protein BG005_000322 [Podila minutissima]|nr:hypothetical protein BG005_000322 [Podila minutissima]
MDTTTVEQDTPPDTSTDTPMSTTTSTFSGSSAPTSPHYSDSALFMGSQSHSPSLSETRSSSGSPRMEGVLGKASKLYESGVQPTSTTPDAVTDKGPSNSSSNSPTLTSATNDLSNMTINFYHYRVFDIPEIVRCIAEFLDKPSLAIACRISHLWQDHCTPLLWRHIEDKNWSHSHFCSAIGEKAVYVRSMRCKHRTDYEEIALYDFPRLLSVSFQGSKEGFNAKEMILQRVATTLTTLVLSAVSKELTAANVRTICGIKNLEKLKISATIVLHPQLATLLDQCTELEFLSLSRVQFQRESDDDEWTLPDGIHLSERETERCYEKVVQQATKIKYLALKEVSLSCHYLSEITRLCPDLLELSLARNEDLYMTGTLIQSMARTCSSLYALDISSCKLLDRETFITVFQALSGLTIINLSGTHVADEELWLLAESCRNVSRLDIRYCTSITSQGMHGYMSRCSPALRHLEASGVMLDPSTFDDNKWTCSNLETCFVHIGLFGPKSTPTIASSTSTESTDIPESVLSLASSDIELLMDIDPPDTLFGRIGGAKDAILSMLTSGPKYEEGKREVDLVHKNDREEGSHSSVVQDPLGDTSSTSSSLSSSPASVHIRHPLHPIQELTNVQYLGLMGYGPKLTRNAGSTSTISRQPTHLGLLHGFQSVKRLNLLELNQSFQLDDLKWLVESLPELCRVDAERYNVSDEVMKEFQEQPWSNGVQIHRYEY